MLEIQHLGQHQARRPKPARSTRHALSLPADREPASSTPFVLVAIILVPRSRILDGPTSWSKLSSADPRLGPSRRANTLRQRLGSRTSGTRPTDGQRPVRRFERTRHTHESAGNLCPVRCSGRSDRAFEFARKTLLHDFPRGGFAALRIAVVGNDGHDHLSFRERTPRAVPHRVRSVVPVHGAGDVCWDLSSTSRRHSGRAPEYGAFCTLPARAADPCRVRRRCSLA